MTKLEKVIKGLESIHAVALDKEQLYVNHMSMKDFNELLADTLELLKEREAVKPKEVKLWYTEYACGYCDYKSVGRKDGYKMRFCPCCGRAVKWE